MITILREGRPDRTERGGTRRGQFQTPRPTTKGASARVQHPYSGVGQVGFLLTRVVAPLPPIEAARKAELEHLVRPMMGAPRHQGLLADRCSGRGHSRIGRPLADDPVTPQDPVRKRATRTAPGKPSWKERRLGPVGFGQIGLTNAVTTRRRRER